MTYEDILAQNEEHPMTLGEPALKQESSTEEKIAYLRATLHPSTSEYLEALNWMVDKSFPYDASPSDESWTEEADDENPAISNDIIIQDRKAWINAV